MPSRLAELVQRPLDRTVDPVPQDMALEVRMAIDEQSSMDELDAIGHRVPLTCPECGGTLWEMPAGKALRFRCHVGHAYNERTLEAEQSGQVESALWAALRSLEERERLAQRLSAQAHARGHARSAAFHREAARAAASHAAVLRALLGGARGVVGETRA